MSFDHLDLVTVLGQVLTLDEQPAGGKVTFDTTVQLVDLTTGQAIFPVPLTVTLDGDGTFTIDLPATDDPDLAPTGWTYQVNVDVVGSKRRSFPLSVPHGTGPLELFLAAPVATSPGVYITRGPQGDPGPAGPAGPAGDLTMAAATAAFQTKADAAAQSATFAPLGWRERDLLNRQLVDQLMTSPPTVATGSGTALGTNTSAIPNKVAVPYNTPGVRFLGGVPGGRFGLSNYYLVATLGNNDSSVLTVEFMHLGSRFEFGYDLFDTTNGWRMRVDGKFVSLTPTTNAGSTGQRYNTLIDFGSRKTRHIVLELDQMAFGGLNIDPGDSVWQPPAKQVQTLVVGDSYTTGVGAKSRVTGWVYWMARRLGWGNIWNAGIGGTGWTVAGSYDTFQGRLTTLATAAGLNPDYIVFMGGFNDLATATAGALQAAVTATLNAYHAQWPKAKIIVAGIQIPRGSTNANPTLQAALNAGVAAAAGSPFLIDMQTTPWVSGTGYGGVTPPNLKATVSTAHGGTLGPGGLFFVITATNSNGETKASNEVTPSSGSAFSALLTWDDQPDATGYKVYGGYSSGGEATLVTTLAAGTTSYEVLALSGSTASPPGTSTTGSTGTGNSDVVISPDGVHPSQAGHDYHGDRMLTALAASLPS